FSKDYILCLSHKPSNNDITTLLRQIKVVGTTGMIEFNGELIVVDDVYRGVYKEGDTIAIDVFEQKRYGVIVTNIQPKFTLIKELPPIIINLEEFESPPKKEEIIL